MMNIPTLTGRTSSDDLTHELKYLTSLLLVLALHDGLMSHKEVEVGFMFHLTPMPDILTRIIDQSLTILLT